jgi:hypothetical protein
MAEKPKRLGGLGPNWKGPASWDLGSDVETPYQRALLSPPIEEPTEEGWQYATRETPGTYSQVASKLRAGGMDPEEIVKLFKPVTLTTAPEDGESSNKSSSRISKFVYSLPGGIDEVYQAIVDLDDKAFTSQSSFEKRMSANLYIKWVKGSNISMFEDITVDTFRRYFLDADSYGHAVELRTRDGQPAGNFDRSQYTFNTTPPLGF